MSDELQKELDDMIGGLGETSAEEETKTSTEEETDVKSTEEESTGEKPAEEETKEEEVSTDEESETETALTEKEEDKEGEALQVEKLLKRIEELTVVEPIESVKPTDKKDEVISKEEKPIEVKEVEADSTKIDFIGDAKIDDLVDDKDKLNAVFQAVHARAVSDSNKQVYEKVLRAIPEIVLGHINRNASVGGLVKDFYDANKDLVPVKKTVAAVANTLHAEHPDWDLPRVFKEAAPKTREILGMGKPVKKDSKEFDDPAFADVDANGKQTVKTDPNSQQSQINDLLGF